jgi:PPE-repeat protein
VIAANRALLTALVATNLFGQNTPAIAATESQYAEMWAQDAAAMYGYAGSTATVTSGLPTFDPAPQTTTGASAATSPPTVASQLTSTALQALASPAATVPASGSALSTLSDLAGLTLFLPTLAQAGLEPVDFAADFTDFGLDEEDFDLEEQLANAGYALLPISPSGAVPDMTGPAAAFSPVDVPAVTAGLGRAASVGGLAVPPAWTVAAPAIRSVAWELPAASLGAAPAVWTGSTGTLFSEIGLAGMAGSAIGGTASTSRRAVSDKLGDTTDYREQIAATLGGADAAANKRYRSDTGSGEGELLEQVATRYPAVFALLGALCSPDERDTEAGLAKLEREIRSLAARFTTGR